MIIHRLEYLPQAHCGIRESQSHKWHGAAQPTLLIHDINAGWGIRKIGLLEVQPPRTGQGIHVPAFEKFIGAGAGAR